MTQEAAGMTIESEKEKQSHDAPSKPSHEVLDASEIARLLIEKQDVIVGYILACVRHHSDADDIFQEVSVAAIELRDQLRDREGFGPWVRQIARFRILKHFEKSKRQMKVTSLVDNLAEVADEMDTEGVLDERARCLNECLNSLPKRSKQMILMRYASSPGAVDEIARQIDRSVQATYALLKRIRMTLRECVSSRMSQLEG